MYISPTEGTTRAYLAGLFDGEGSISICVVHPGKTNRLKSPTHRLSVAVANTDRALMCWLHGTLGGSAPPRLDSSRAPRAGRGTPCWSWSLQCNDARKFLEDVSPYLRVKRERATLAIEFQLRRGGSAGNFRPTLEQVALRERYRQRLLALNARGVHAGLVRRPLTQSAAAPFVRPSYGPLDNVTGRAYLAGLLDGEGSICISLAKPGGATRRKAPSHCLNVGVTNTDWPLIDWLRTSLGGSICAGRVSAPTARPVWTWRLTGNSAKDFLGATLPYLRVKRARAELAVEFQTQRAGRRGNKKLTPEQLAEREHYRLLISSMNAGGGRCVPMQMG